MKEVGIYLVGCPSIAKKLRSTIIIYGNLHPWMPQLTQKQYGIISGRSVENFLVGRILFSQKKGAGMVTGA